MNFEFPEVNRISFEARELVANQAEEIGIGTTVNPSNELL